jgi:potassium efflux system protein
MRINELLVEEQVDEISLAGIGRGIGKAVGGVAQGVGAVAGGIAGIPGAVKKGFQAGKAVVSGDDEAPAQTNAPATTSAPAAGGVNYQAAVANKAAAAPSGTPAAKPTANTGTTPPAAGAQTPPASTTAAPEDDTADKGFGFDGHTGKPFASQEERTAWFKANNKVDPKAAGTAPAATTPAPGNTAPQATPPATTPAPTTGAPADATAPAKTGKVGVPAGKAAVDQAVGVVQSVRSDRRQDVVKYAKDKIDALQKAPAPAAAPAATPGAAPAATTPPPEEDNPNIVKGYNENVDRILYLTRVLNQAK